MWVHDLLEEQWGNHRSLGRVSKMVVIDKSESRVVTSTQIKYIVHKDFAFSVWHWRNDREKELIS